MSNPKRPREGGEKANKRYRAVRKPLVCHAQTSHFRSQDGTPIWGKRAIDGPGIWVSCVKGKEKQTVGELYDLFEGVSRYVA